MPGKGPGPSIKNPKVYEALKRKGFSKSSAAAISNAQVEDDEDAADGASIEWLSRDREFSAAERKTAAKKGQAMPHGGYPIKNKGDLKNAISAFGRAKNKAATKAHIKKRAAALGATEMLPENWDSMTGKGTGGLYDQWMATADTKVCPRCDGEGLLSSGEVCPTCEGHGNVEPAQPYVQGVGPAGEVNVRLAVPSAHMGINNTGGGGGSDDDKLLRTLARHVQFSRKVKSLMSGQGLPPNLEQDALPPQFTCPACHGTGNDPDADSELPGGRCDACGGTGYIDNPDNNGSHWREDPGPYPAGGLSGDRKRDDDDDDDDDDLKDGAPFMMRDSIRLVVDEGKVRKTQDGYLVANARIARTGIQLYDGSEVGRPDMGTVRVYRPESEVFSRKTMASLAGKPVTLDHPPEMVDADNWKQYAIGSVGEDIARDGDTVRVPMMIMDGNAIRAYERDGVSELSVGYSTELKWGEGKTPNGETYDAIQTGIRGNHLAVVSAARGGSQLRIGDDHQKGANPMVNILVDGRLVEFSNDANAKHVTDYILKLQADAKKAKDDAAEEEQEEEKKTRGAKDAEFAALKGENVALKKQLEDALAKGDAKAIEDRAKQHIDLLLKADAVMEGKGNFDGKSAEEIRRQVVMAKMGDAAKDLSDAEMIGAFKILTASIKPRSGTDRLADSLNLLGNNAGTNMHDSPTAARDAAYQEYVKRQQDAWKQPRAS